MTNNDTLTGILIITVAVVTWAAWGIAKAARWLP